MSDNEISLKEHFEDKLEVVNDKIEKLEDRFDKLEENISTRMDEKVDNLSEKMGLMLENIQLKLDQTYEQTKKTNGRVNKHDEKFEKLDQTHYNCPGSKALFEIQETKKTSLEYFDKRLKEQEELTEVISFFTKHPQITKGIVIAFIILLILWSTKISIETLPELLKFLIELLK